MGVIKIIVDVGVSLFRFAMERFHSKNIITFLESKRLAAENNDSKPGKIFDETESAEYKSITACIPNNTANKTLAQLCPV